MPDPLGHAHFCDFKVVFGLLVYPALGFCAEKRARRSTVMAVTARLPAQISSMLRCETEMKLARVAERFGAISLQI
jgi:hypothetical protein